MKPLRIILAWSLAVPLALTVMVQGHSAKAVPAFARQTGQECQACHVGSFGPQLTAYGRAFKLNGYVWGPNESYLDHFAGMVYGGYEHTKAKEPQDGSAPPLNRFGSNDNITVDQASLFYGGRLLDNVGVLAQATYHDPNRAFAWDNTDIRYADSGTMLGKDLVYGVTVNNNPSVQDVWQTTPGWTFPYLGPTLPANPFAGIGQPQLTSGNFAQKVAGLGAYGLWNDLVYAELSGYHSLGNGAQTMLGVMGSDSADHLRGVNPYWRLALQHDYGEHYVSFGTYGMAFDRYPGNDRSQGSDHLTDYGLDATYQATLGGGDHIVSVYATALKENLDLKATQAAGNADNAHDTLKTFRANASYYYHNTWGVTVGRFETLGNTDATYYAAGLPTQNGKPNSAGYQAQFDVTPTGMEESLGYPYLNARLFVQYTYYTKFAGGDKNYDGNGTSAGDNNTLYTGIWFAF
jgi:hypothetical protein